MGGGGSMSVGGRICVKKGVKKIYIIIITMFMSLILLLYIQYNLCI